MFMEKSYLCFIILCSATIILNHLTVKMVKLVSLNTCIRNAHNVTIRVLLCLFTIVVQNGSEGSKRQC